MSDVSPETNAELPENYPDLRLIIVNPALNNLEIARDVFDAYMKGNPKAIILQAYGTGTVPSVLTPIIKEVVDKGVPVFLVSANYGDETGITKLAYEANMGAVGAGAIPLRDVNIKHLPQIMGSVQWEINQGKKGHELGEAIIQRFGTPVVPAAPK